MLAELQEVANSLRAAGIAPPTPHPWVKPQEKGDFLIAGLDENGCVAEVELRAWDESTRLFKIQKDNQNSFPVYKLDAPLWDVAASDPARAELKRAGLPAEERAAILQRLCAASEPAISEADRKRLKARLQEFARELQPLFLEHREDAPAVCLLIGRVLREDFDVTRLLCQIRDGVIAEVSNDRDTRKRIGEALLIGSLNPKTSKVNEGKVTFVLDIDAGDRWRGDFERVAHPAMGAVYHRALSGRPDAGGKHGICALTGTEQLIETGTFPAVKFPVIDNTILFSMNPDTGCHDRYGLIGSGICPVGKATEDEIYQAAFWVTSAERRNKTWRGVPEARGDKNDLLIAYIEQSAETDLELARVFSEGDDSERVAVFESASASLVEALDAKGAVTRDWTCRVLVLHRISKGQVQVQISRRYSVARIRAALREWREGVLNTPPISTRLPGKSRGDPAELYSPRSLFPGEVMRATKSIWIRGGTERQAVAGCGLGRIYDLFLGGGRVSEEAAAELLRTMLDRVGPLLARFGAGSDVSPAGRKATVDACTILATCLYRLGERKEKYMDESAFLLGKFLSLADLLHLQYCVVKRDGDVPPQLLGNQHLAVAALNPVEALSLLGDRLRIYMAWAGSDRRGEAALGKWAVGRMGEVASELTGRLPERAMTDREKAEMLLGYLAREAKSQGDEGEKKEDVA
jgi:hypothetical protein